MSAIVLNNYVISHNFNGLWIYGSVVSTAVTYANTQADWRWVGEFDCETSYIY